MPTVTDLLRECHRLRKHLKNLQEEIDRGPRVLKAQQNRLAAEEKAHKDHHDSITKLKVKQREEEGTLKATETRLDKLREQLNLAANKKEFDAKESEIKQATEKKGQTEDIILETILEIETHIGQIPEVDKKWADAQAEFKQWQIDAAERLERLKADQIVSRAELEKYDTQLPDKVKTYYDFHVKSRGPDAMAAVKERVCQGCRATLTEQWMFDLRAGNFLTCVGCGRLLYLTDSTPVSIEE